MARFSRRTPQAAALRALPAVLLLLAPAIAGAVPIRVRGGATLDAHARFRDDQTLELGGRLVDEVGAPIADAIVEIATDSALDVGAAERCSPPVGSLGRPPSRGVLAVHPAASGELCVRWRQPPERGLLRLRFAGDRLHGATELTVSFDQTLPQRTWATLRFDPRPSVIDLDRPSTTLGTLLSLPAGEPAAARADQTVEIRDRAGTLLGRARTGGDGKAHVTVATSSLGEPRDEELRAELAQPERLAVSGDRQPVALRAAVSLRLAGALPAARRGERATLAVAATALRGTVDGGVVEAALAGHVLASGPVQQGRASVSFRLPADAASELELTLRYLPAAPSWSPGSPLPLTLRVASPSKLRSLGWAALVALAAAWVLLGWRRARRAKDDCLPATAAEPGVHVIRRIARGTRWRGTVVDAHDGAPLEGASLEVLGGTDALACPEGESREARAPLVQASTDADGAFSFELRSLPMAAELHVHHRNHSSQRRALPPPGLLRVALATRRRALLQRLVEWAKARGGRFARAPEPTPADVQRAAHDEPAAAQWAANVEVAAFGSRDPDAAHEERLHAEQPPAPSPPPGAPRTTEEASEPTESATPRSGSD